jgi:predicted DNA-binding transcriptional regulator YafY
MKTKKYLPRADMPRIYFIDQKIASGRYPNTPSLAREYEISTSTISRDIEYMRERLGAPIEYDALRRGYYYSEKTFRLTLNFDTADEVLALSMAKNLLAMFKDTPVYDTVNKLLVNIIAPARDRLNAGAERRGKGTPLLRRPTEDVKKKSTKVKSPGRDGAWLENRIVVPPPPKAIVNAALWETLTGALRENRIITFEYRGAADDDFRLRRARPYQLLFDNGVWYLYAYAEDRKAGRIFSLPRMRNTALCAETFILPDDYDFNRRFPESSFGVFAGMEKYRFKVTFWGGSALWVRERQWAADQALEEDADDDAVTITFTSTQYDKVLEWVLSQGCMALPLAPARLVEDWTGHIAEMAKLAEIPSREDGKWISSEALP